MANPVSEYVRSKLDKDATASVDFDAMHRQQFQQLTDHATLPEHPRVLDVACGTGKWAAYLASRGMTVHCADLQAEFLTLAQQRARSAGHTLSGVQADGIALPYRTGSFDVVTLYSVLEHVPDWEGLIRESVRVLAPGGVLWVTTTNVRCPVTHEIGGFPLYPWYPGWVKSRVMKWVQENRPELIAHSPAPAVHWFTYAQLISHVESIGCEKTATLVDYLEPSRGGWRVPVIQAIRGSKALRLAFEFAQPGCGLLTRKGTGAATAQPRPEPRPEPALPPNEAKASGEAARLSDDLKQILVCPSCKGEVEISESEKEIRCSACSLGFLFANDVPVMLIGAARSMRAQPNAPFAGELQRKR